MQQDSGTCALTKAVAAHTGSAQIQTRQGPSAGMGKWTQAVIPNSGASSNEQPLTKISFSKGVLLRI